MYVKRHYSLWLTVRWSRKPLLYGFIYSAAVIAIYEYTAIPFPLPWEPISVIGIAVAFYLGFKNNSSYDRMWEARKIWGAIVNDSRTFATAVLAIPADSGSSTGRRRSREMVYRHLAWLVALRRTLRTKKSWEHDEDPATLKFAPTFSADYPDEFHPEIMQYLSEAEYSSYAGKSNLCTQILKNQTEALASMRDEGLLDTYAHVWLHQLVGKMYDHQGMCERIKNFPLPRQYASTALWITYMFCALIPFGLLSIFERSEYLTTWLSIPFSTLIIWIFFLMDRIGDYSENPFEGAYNDVPISSITRTIEIDLREMIGDAEIPKPYPVENGFLM